MNIDQYLKQQNVIAISGIDTRHLTKKLREYGVMNGAVTTEYETVDREKLLADIRFFYHCGCGQVGQLQNNSERKKRARPLSGRSDGFWLQKKYCSFAKKPWLRRNDRSLLRLRRKQFWP